MIKESQSLWQLLLIRTWQAKKPDRLVLMETPPRDGVSQ